MVACGTTLPTPDIEATVEAVVGQRIANQPAGSLPALSSSGAESILRNFLLDCIESWLAPVPQNPRVQRTPPPAAPTGAEVDWWQEIATGMNGPPWSARFLGTENGRERWAVYGAGMERVGDELFPVQGTWQIFAGQRIATPLDGPAQIANREFKRPLDAYYNPDCR